MRLISCGAARPVAVFTLALLIVAFAMPYGARAAGLEFKPELRYGNVVAGIDFTSSGMSQDLFHKETLASSDTEAMAISFPGGGPGATIAQSSDRTIAGSATGFVTADYAFYPCVNYGAAPVGFGHMWDPYPVTPALFYGNSLLFPEMVAQRNLIDNEELRRLDAPKITLPPPEAAGATSQLMGLYGLEGINNSSWGAREGGMPVILSTRTIDFDASPAQINNTSIVERLWRNSHLGHLLPYAYEGDAAYPSWLMPVKNPYGLMEMQCPTNVFSLALDKTRPGSYLIRSFWTL
jgi:hypothetical protein